MFDAIYYPILRAKAGEINAIGSLRARTKTLVRPMFDLPECEDPSELATIISSATMALAKNWGTKLPIYLDLSRHDWDATLTGGRSIVGHLFECARQAGLIAIPVTGPVIDRQGETGLYFKEVANIIRQRGQGVALRLRFDEMERPDSLKKVVDEALLAVACDNDQADIFLDVGPVDKLPKRSGETVQSMLLEAVSDALSVVKGGSFRNIIFAGSGIPRKVKRTVDGTPFRVPNYEYATWSQLLNTRDWRSIRFSDYGARYAHQTEGGGGAAPPARIQLVTESEHILYFDKGHLYRDLADSSLTDPALARQAGFRGKASIRDAARGSGGVGSATDWVARDTSMHIETIADSISGRIQELGFLQDLRTAEISTELDSQSELQLTFDQRS
jgi:hypothetical protein